MAGVAVAGALVVIAALANRQGLFWPSLGFIIAGLYIYRKMRHRTLRLIKRFSSKVARIPEVRLIMWQQTKVTVVVDHIRAKIYLRVNSLMEEVNSKLFFGEPLTVVVRDDVAADEFRKLLYEPGVLYLRDDALESPSPPKS
jgi:hypothetical protein